MEKGKIIKNISNQYTVLLKNKTFLCTPRGKFRKLGISPFVGDEVEFDLEKLTIENILPRKNELKRPNVANIDYVLIVTSLKEPQINYQLLDKQITYSFLNNITPIICFTKLDLASLQERQHFTEERKIYEQIGLKTFTNENLTDLINTLQNKIIVLTGQSGVGKSSLLNKLDPNLHLKTNEISFALNRGKHTTRHTELYKIKNIWFCDTPGFSSLDLSNYNKEQIKNSFPEFKNYQCKFLNCFHDKEKDCQIKQALAENKISRKRYENYLNFLKEVK